MKSYKESSFQDRRGRAAEAKEKALEQYRSRSPLDAKVMADRMAASVNREAAKAVKAAAKKVATDAAAAEALAKASVPLPLTEAERKAGRDARYAARKSRR